MRISSPSLVRCSAACLAWIAVTGLVIALVGNRKSEAQQPAVPAEARQFAPGVLMTIPPEIEPEETVSTHDIVEIRADRGLQWDPELISKTRTLYALAEKVRFRRDVWCLEFAFKPLRMIDVDVPGTDGTARRKRVWYLVYRVTNRGSTLRTAELENGNFQTDAGSSEPIRFIPQFVLEGHDRAADGRQIYQAYLDRVIPAAVEAIRRRETPARPLLNSAEMALEPLPVSDGRTDQGVWGVATWSDVDPRIDFFSVFVSGLTNSYRWLDPPGAYAVSDPPGKGRRFARKTLQLNFWRPGDEHLEHEEEIRFGVAPGKAALYGVADGVAYQWVYR